MFDCVGFAHHSQKSIFCPNDDYVWFEGIEDTEKFECKKCGSTLERRGNYMWCNICQTLWE